MAAAGRDADAQGLAELASLIPRLASLAPVLRFPHRPSIPPNTADQHTASLRGRYGAWAGSVAVNLNG
jgi:hypothetical protein